MNLRNVLAYLVHTRPLVYLFIIAFIGYMVGSSLTKVYNERQTKISELDNKKTSFIHEQESKLAPIVKERKETEAKLKTLTEKESSLSLCIDEVKKTLGSMEVYQCDKGTFITQVRAEELGTASGAIVPPPERSKEDRELMEKICQKSPTSPLCNNFQMFDKLKSITTSELPEAWFPIMVGITYAESHIGVDFSKDNVGGTCAGRNNWGGVKGRVNKGGRVLHDQPIPDAYSCWLYKFDNIYDYWESKTNIIAYNYKPCVNAHQPIRCMSWNYVGSPDVAEQSWIGNVSQFIP